MRVQPLRLMLIILSVLFLTQCKLFFGNDSQEKRQNISPAPTQPQKKSDGKFNILVVDDGFDLDLDVFKGKVLGNFRYKCDDSKRPNRGDDEPISYEDFKTRTIEFNELEADFELNHCEVVNNDRSGISPRFNDIAEYKELWNKRISNKSALSASDLTPAELVQIEELQQNLSSIDDVLNGEGGKYSYHGTQVASVMAFQNPNVNVLAVHIDLGAPSDPDDSDSEGPECPQARELEWFARLYEDQEYFDAKVNLPVGTFERELEKLSNEHDIDIFNASFGRNPFAVTVELLEEAGCNPAGFLEFLVATEKFDEKVKEARVKKNGAGRNLLAVSYTHLTLPTIYSV